jgi:hypothetical protein
MLKPALLLLIPEIIRAMVGAFRDHMAARRAEAEARKLEAERKAKEGDEDGNGTGCA